MSKRELRVCFGRVALSRNKRCAIKCAEVGINKRLFVPCTKKPVVSGYFHILVLKCLTQIDYILTALEAVWMKNVEKLTIQILKSSQN